MALCVPKYQIATERMFMMQQLSAGILEQENSKSEQGTVAQDVGDPDFKQK